MFNVIKIKLFVNINFNLNLYLFLIKIYIQFFIFVLPKHQQGNTKKGASGIYPYYQIYQQSKTDLCLLIIFANTSSDVKNTQPNTTQHLTEVFMVSRHACFIPKDADSRTQPGDTY